MLKKLLIFIAMCALSSGQLASAQEETMAQDGHARVRFFGQAVIKMAFYADKACYGGKGVQTSRSGFGGVFSSKKNTSLGMPDTPNVLNLKDRNGFLSNAFYREYSVKADMPLTIVAALAETSGRYSYSCPDIGLFFVPENGRDYEVSFDYGNGICRLNVTQIESTDTDVKLLPIELFKAEKCSAQN